MSFRIARTRSIGWPFGSSSGQSSRLRPGTYGHSSPHPTVIRRCAPGGELSCELLGTCATKVDSVFAHDLHDLWMDPAVGPRAGGDCSGLGGVHKLVEVRGGHLRTAGVVNASEDDGLHAPSNTTTASRCGRTFSVFVTRHVSSAFVSRRRA
jgi:hypothetical protein